MTEAESDRGKFFWPRLGFFKKSNGWDTVSRPSLPAKVKAAAGCLSDRYR